MKILLPHSEGRLCLALGIEGWWGPVWDPGGRIHLGRSR